MAIKRVAKKTPPPSGKKKAPEAPPPNLEGGKFEVVGGGHLDGNDFYQTGSIVESDEPLDRKFVNAFKRLPDDAEPTSPTPLNADDVPKAHQVKSPAMGSGTEDAGADPRPDKKEVEHGAGETAPGEDVTSAFENDYGVTVFQKEDGTFVTRDEDGDVEHGDSDSVTALIDGHAASEKKAKKSKKK